MSNFDDLTYGAQLAELAKDARNGHHEITRRWGELLSAIASVGWDLTKVEANGPDPSRAILTSLEHLDQVEEALDAIKEYLIPFQQVALEAIRKSTEGQP